MPIIFDPREFEIAHHVDCGIALFTCNRHLQAILEFDAALRLDPNNRHARWDRCLALLSLGKYVEGMPEHDWAFQIYDWQALGHMHDNVDRILARPEWNGERCKLITYHQMGFGDAIMIMRFLEDLAGRCESVTLVVREELASLMQGRGVEVVSEVPQDCSVFDAQVSFFNSIWKMGRCHSIPTRPYIKVDFKPRGGRMGIVWSGKSQQNFTLERFLSHLGPQDNYELQSLQKTGPLPHGIRPLPDEFDFRDTANLIAELDVIVTIDTAAAHLAGAMGHPNAHVVLPYLRDWRWWCVDRWYPTLRIHPQLSPGNWDEPFAEVNLAIRGK